MKSKNLILASALVSSLSLAQNGAYKNDLPRDGLAESLGTKEQKNTFNVPAAIKTPSPQAASDQYICCSSSQDGLLVSPRPPTKQESVVETFKDNARSKYSAPDASAMYVPLPSPSWSTSADANEVGVVATPPNAQQANDKLKEKISENPKVQQGLQQIKNQQNCKDSWNSTC